MQTLISYLYLCTYLFTLDILYEYSSSKNLLDSSLEWSTTCVSQVSLITRHSPSGNLYKHKQYVVKHFKRCSDRLGFVNVLTSQD